MIGQAARPVLLIDRSKLSARGFDAIAPVSELALVLAHGLGDDELRVINDAAVAVRTVQPTSESGATVGHRVR